MIFLSANNSSPVPSCTSKADELWCSCRLSAAETCWRRGADRHGEAMLEQTDSVSHLKTQVSMLEPKMLLIHFGLKTHHSVSKYRASSLSKHFVEQEHKSPTATLHIWRVCPQRRTFSSPTYIGNNLGLCVLLKSTSTRGQEEPDPTTIFLFNLSPASAQLYGSTTLKSLQRHFKTLSKHPLVCIIVTSTIPVKLLLILPFRTILDLRDPFSLTDPQTEATCSSFQKHCQCLLYVADSIDSFETYFLI